VFPDAKVCAKCTGHGVTIKKDGQKLVSVAQRDMYSKYQWPAKGAIIEALKKLK